MKSELKKITDRVVEDISGSLITCFLNGQEVRLWACAPQYVELRSADRLELPCRSLHFFYYRGRAGAYEKLEIEDMQNVSIVQEKEIPFSSLRVGKTCTAWSTILRITFCAYTRMYEDVTNQYYKYIQLKSESYDNEFSKVLVGYPAELDESFAGSFEEWRSQRLSQSRIAALHQTVMESGVEMVRSLENQAAYQSYLIEKNTQNDTNVTKYTRLYIGSQFCHNLFPDRQTLFSLLQKAQTEHLAVTLVTTYLRECLREQTRSVINAAYNWCVEKKFSIEVIVNDWGMFALLKGKEDYMKPVLGLLLNKRRKDPRYRYKTGFYEHQEQMMCNQLNQHLFEQFICGLGVQRAEYEACGYFMRLSENLPHKTLHLPLYQTNTSQFCTLYALCRNGNRARQQFVTQCPQYCCEYVCMYPQHLDLIGKYNSLFGMDGEMTTEFLTGMIRQGVDRIVWNL